MKNQLRAHYKAVRAGIPLSERLEKSKKIADLFLQRFGNFESYFIFNGFGTEVDTKPIIQALLQAKKRVYLPRVEGEKMVAVPYGETKKGAYGIMEPLGAPYFGKIDVVAVPLLAVDEKGYRLGYGGGYYDKFLQVFTGIAVGLGFCEQRAQSLPHDKWDVPLHAFVCDGGVTDFTEKV